MLYNLPVYFTLELQNQLLNLNIIEVENRKLVGVVRIHHNQFRATPKALRFYIDFKIKISNPFYLIFHATKFLFVNAAQAESL